MDTFITIGAAREICEMAVTKIIEDINLLASRNLIKPGKQEWYKTKLSEALDTISGVSIQEALGITEDWQNTFNQLLNDLASVKAA